MLNIGNIELREKPLFLAPMEDVTDPSFRYLCKIFGADMMYTEFISSDGLIREGRKSVKKLEISDDERPIGIQLYGHLIESMVEATKIVTAVNPDVIDIGFEGQTELNPVRIHSNRLNPGSCNERNGFSTVQPDCLTGTERSQMTIA